ncbi:uncharacterized protein MELLADRAFT_123873 [Melampsora larici-populina 98AG31]|uniref:Secreted protein n=1 Tax=Melampsora larici-populina (strain 98AG31 / pathotype 3-4-7) TaxID=747676 RepID=F4SBV1_MELLP|nr:uncharacterized protein MELLADRAFT_123873 [Melampsora larici-populina 98AG31]EGF97878.1 secreted protein [Melampsora larici-populina 98AG31]
MFWNRSIPTLLLVFLLAGNPGSPIFASADVCSYSWTPGHVGERGQPALAECGTSSTTYLQCTQCGRSDGKPPAAQDCTDESGKPFGGSGDLTCDVAYSISTAGVGGRKVLCTHTHPGGTSDQVYCLRLVRPQQCSGCNA